MTRLSSKPIIVPAHVTVATEDSVLLVTGPKGTLSREVPGEVAIDISGDGRSIMITEAPRTKDAAAILGSFYAHARNMIQGVSEGFTKVLELEGIGYRASVEGKDLVLSLGFSHPVCYTPPAGIDIATEKNEIRVTGIDKELVGQAAAVIREYRKPEPYKGKGIRYKGEHVIRKAGKKAGAAA